MKISYSARVIGFIDLPSEIKQVAQEAKNRENEVPEQRRFHVRDNFEQDFTNLASDEIHEMPEFDLLTRHVNRGENSLRIRDLAVDYDPDNRSEEVRGV